MRKRSFASLVIVLLFAWIGCAVSAQDRGTITVTVVDAATKPLPGVVVQLFGPETRKGVTDARGVLTFELLPAGTYQVRLERSGLIPLTQSANVQAGNTTRLTVRMSVDIKTQLDRAASRGGQECRRPAIFGRCPVCRTGRRR